MFSVSLFGFLLTQLAFVACGIGFFVPYWLYIPRDSLDHILAKSVMYKFDRAGIIAWCNVNGPCMWYWHNNFELVSPLPEWYKASQALYGFGFVILLSTDLLALLDICCRCCCRRSLTLATAIGSLIIAGCVLIGAAIGVFVAFQKEWYGDSAQYLWGFFVAVGGVGAALLAAIFFICDGCRDRRVPDGYTSARKI